MNVSEFKAGLAEMMDRTFDANQQLKDHRQKYPWCTGSLGNPFAGIWFVAERPSLHRLKEIGNAPDFVPSSELQWAISNGDKLFRRALFASGFKSGGELTPGGWNCYVTNLVKDCDGKADFFDRARIWSDVFRWEFEKSIPRLIVLMGKTRLPKAFSDVMQMMKHLHSDPEIIDSYAYVALRARGTLGPMHPSRVSEYLHSFEKIRMRFDSGREQ